MTNIIKHRDRGELILTEPVIGIKNVSGCRLGAEGDEHYWRAYSAAWGLVPYAYEPAILASTAFDKTLQDQGNAIPIVFNHDMNMPVAKNGGNSVDDYGLQYKAIPDLSGNDPESARIYHKIKSGQLFQNSIGFTPIRIDKDKESGLPIYTEAYLDHHSIVTKAANPGAKVVEIYSADIEEYGATAYQNLPIIEKAWDAAAAKKRVAAWAGGDDMNWSKYAKAFLWFDSADKEKIGAYKLPYADVIDGGLKAVTGGIYAAAGAIRGARARPDIPEADIARIRAHLARYYRRMDKETPWSADSIIAFRLDELQDYVIILTEAENAPRDAEPPSSPPDADASHLRTPSLISSPPDAADANADASHLRKVTAEFRKTLKILGGSR